MYGIISLEVMEIYHTQQYFQDHSFIARTLASICSGENYKDYMDVSAIDAQRILMLARINTYNSNVYEMKNQYCGHLVEDEEGNSKTCNTLLYVPFNLRKDVAAGNLYDVEHDFNGLKIRLKPDTVYDEAHAWTFAQTLTQNGKNLGEIFSKLCKSRILSVNGDREFNPKTLSVEIMEWLQEKLSEEKTKMDAMSDTTVKCDKCGNESTFTIGFFNQPFVLKK